jgi:hypothetical protein
MQVNSQLHAPDALPTGTSFMYPLNGRLSGLQSRSRQSVYIKSLAGFEVLTAVVTKSTIFWDITPCSPLKVNRRFGGTYRLHLQGGRKSRATQKIVLFRKIPCPSGNRNPTVQPVPIPIKIDLSHTFLFQNLHLYIKGSC